MPEIIRTFDGDFIGIVYGYNIIDRTLDVFIPKLMPAIPENRRDISSMTNMGNRTIDIQYNHDITTASTITVMATDIDEPLPKIGSRVFIEFLDGNPNMGYWRKWNSKGDYEVIDEEKYSKLFNVKIGDKEFKIDNDDELIIELPAGMKLISTTNGKTKKVKILLENDITEKISDIEKMLGNPSFIRQYTDPHNNIRTENIEAAGLHKTIEELTKRISVLERKE